MIKTHADGSKFSLQAHILKRSRLGWRDGSWVKRTAYSSRGPGINSQYLWSGSQLSIAPGPGDPAPSPGLQGHQACMWFTDIHTHRQNTQAHMKDNLLT